MVQRGIIPAKGEIIDNDTLRFYLSKIRSGDHYTLTPVLAERRGFIRQKVDFKDRSDTNGTFSSSLIDSSIDVSNGISFVSKRLTESIEIIGSFTGSLKVSINKKEDQINYGTGKDVSDETIADAKIPLEVRWYNSSFIKVPVYVSSKHL